MIIKSLAVFNNTANSALVAFQVATAGGDNYVDLARNTLTASSSVYIDRWVVLQAGDYGTIYCDQPNVTYWVSGTVLVGDSPYEPPVALTVGTRPGAEPFVELE